MPTLQHRSGPSLFSHHPQPVSQPFHTRPVLTKSPARGVTKSLRGCQAAAAHSRPVGRPQTHTGRRRGGEGAGGQGPGSSQVSTAGCGGRLPLPHGHNGGQAARPGPVSAPHTPLPRSAAAPPAAGACPEDRETLPPTQTRPEGTLPAARSPSPAGEPRPRSPPGPSPTRRIATGHLATSGSRRRT